MAKYKPLTVLFYLQFTFFNTLLVLLLAGQLTAQSVAGTWQTFHEGSGEPLSMIEIEEKGGSIEGRIKKIYLQTWEGESPLCIKCTGERKGQPVVGMEILIDR